MIRTHEEHGELVATWHELGYSREEVVCFDRHLDLKPLTADQHSKLRSITTSQELIEQNRKLPIRGIAGTYGLDDFYAVGASRGYVSDLHWVMANDSPTSPSVKNAMLGHLAALRAPREILETTAFTTQGALTTMVCGLNLTIYTPTSFAACKVPSSARVDIDLDWFADVGSGPRHDTTELIDLLDLRGLTRHIDSMTYSVRSGFLPSNKRHIANDLAALLRRNLLAAHRNNVPMPEATFDAIRRGGTSNPDDVRNLGATGVALLGIVAANGGRYADAAQLWFRAAEGGYSSTWLAYIVGMQEFKRRDYLAASKWFERAKGNGNDPLEVRAELLSAICDLRLGNTRSGLDRLSDLAWSYPLHRRATRLVVEASLRFNADISDDLWLQDEILSRLCEETT